MGAHANAMLAAVLAHGLGGTWHRREVPMGGAVSDLAVIDADGLWAFEVKSERDSLVRLPTQLQGYARVADRIVVACAAKHVGGVARVVDALGMACVGILVADENPPRWARQPAQNEARDAYHLMWSLHARELVSVVEARGPTAARGVRGKSKTHVWRRCKALGITLDEARTGLLRCWPVRDWERWKREREEAAAALAAARGAR